ncbi:MAG: SCO family protein [Nitrospirota bacterium]
MKKALSFLIFVFFLLANNSSANAISNDKIKQTEQIITANESIGKKPGNHILLDQDGNRFSLSEYIGKPIIINFVYTNCSHVCHISTAILAGIRDDMIRELGQNIHILTVSFDYEMDTPQKMKEYGGNFTKDFKYWRFAAGDKKTIEKLTEEFGFSYQKTKDGFDHINMISIMDSKGKIYKNVFYGTGDNDRADKELIESLKGAMLSNASADDILNFTLLMNSLKLICSDYDPVSGTYKLNYYYFIGYILLTILCFIVPIIFMWWKEISSLVIRFTSLAFRIFRMS